MLLSLLGSLCHPVALAAGVALGYLAPGSVSQALAWLKAKL
jgi:hypothetical protein